MTFVRVYLVIYFVLFLGALFALWEAGVLQQLPGSWIAMAAAAAIGFGILLAVVSQQRRVPTSHD